MKRYKRKPLRALLIRQALYRAGLIAEDFDALGVNPLQAGLDLQHITGVKHD